MSQSDSEYITRLMDREVPEISSGAVVIEKIARSPGIRSKIAVVSHSEAIDPVGACVGQRGNRINTITSELSGEKIDVILWSDDPKTFLINALSPSKISDIEIKSSHEAIIYVPADQLSLTIGKNGQNVRLAAKLTGWRIEVRTIEEPSKSIDQGVSEELTTNLEKELPPEEIEKLEEQIEEQPKEQIETEEQLKIKEQSEIKLFDFKKSDATLLKSGLTPANCYAVIISGGYDMANNWQRYWNDCSAIYSALVDVYNYEDDHIYTIMSDGTSTANDRRISGGYDSSPLDLDGDGDNDIQFSATRANITTVFNTLSGLLDSDDYLFIFVTDHGDQESGQDA